MEITDILSHEETIEIALEYLNGHIMVDGDKPRFNNMTASYWTRHFGTETANLRLPNNCKPNMIITPYEFLKSCVIGELEKFD